MDYSKFEDNFNVYTSNPITAMRILTSDIMEDILRFKDTSQYEFDIFINKNNIYIRFHCGRMFENNTIKNNQLDENSFKEYYNILNFDCEFTNKIIDTINEIEI